jgi:phosphoribosylaminoimidazole-succinocarboxamide synthase
MVPNLLEIFSGIFRRLLRSGYDLVYSPDRAPKENVNPVILETNLDGVERYARGKVRDVYQLGDRLLIVATDRISAFDYVLPTGIPDKGRVLTQLSLFWFDFLRDVTPNHLITAALDEYPEPLPRYAGQVEGRSMLVHRARMVEIECVARGYLSGSGWKEYLQHGTVCGIPLPSGLRESEQLPQPIFTPATKAQDGHDENISFDEAASRIGTDLAARLRDLTLDIYKRAAQYAETRGIIIADTKFEFGFVGGELVLGDEVLTPDSSRFWPADTYRPGGAQFSYDKQYVRDYLESIHWNKQPPAPTLPPEIAERTGEKYRQAYRVLTGHDL